MCTMCALHFQQKASSLELELQTVRATMRVLGTEPWVSARATSALNHSAVSSFFVSFFLWDGVLLCSSRWHGTQILLPLLHECWIKRVCHYSQPHFLIVHVYADCVVCEHAIVCMWSSEDTLQELFFFNSLWVQGIEQLGLSARASTPEPCHCPKVVLNLNPAEVLVKRRAVAVFWHLRRWAWMFEQLL